MSIVFSMRKMQAQMNKNTFFNYVFNKNKEN